MEYSDEHTRRYFDSVKQGAYTSKNKHRNSGFLEIIQDLQPSRLLDIGCGQGAFLELVQEACPFADLFGLDVSFGMLSHSSHLLRMIVGSVCHPPLREGTFDIIHCAALLHHLIGSTRGASEEMAQLALRQVTKLLRPGGYLLIEEPFYEPSSVGGVIFGMKKVVCLLTNDKRLKGLGAPVTSFYTRQDIVDMLARAGCSLEYLVPRLWSLDRHRVWGFLPGLMHSAIGFQWGKVYVVASRAE
jgi:SAM-dependent methyltransferase